MSVIAKMYVTESTKYGYGHGLSFSVIAENALMAKCGAAPEDEDVLFTNASPSGSARLIVQNDPKAEINDKFYFIFQRGKKPNLEGATAWAKMKCYGITDYGGTSKQVELTCSAYHGEKYEDSIEARQVNYKILIDNPFAFEQFKAGEDGWWLTIYSAATMTMREALALAHAAKEAVNEAND